MKKQRIFGTALMWVVMLLLSGCGGGGGETPGPPPAPTGVNAVAGPSQVTVQWDNVVGADSYNLYYSTTTGVTKSTGTKISGVSSPHVVSSLTNGTAYFFVVTAVNVNGESVESGEATATPTPNPPPSPPTGVNAVAGPGQVTVTWNNVAGATSYNLYHSTTSGVTKATGTKIAGAVSPETVTGLVKGVPVYFVVTAENADGESSESSEATATPDPPVPSFSQSDLTGIWNVQVVLSGTTPGWYRFTALVDSLGNVTITDPSNSSGVAIPPIPAWTISPGSGTDNTAGIVTESGIGANTTFHGKMSSSKNLITGTSTYLDNTTYALHVSLKRPQGVTYSIDDVTNQTFAYNTIFTGNSHIWEIASGSINGSGQITLTSVEDSNGPVTPPPANFTTVTVSSSGVVSIAADPTFSGILSADKKVIVGTSTDSSVAGAYSLQVIQIRGQIYSLADLAGSYVAHSLHSDATSSWAYAQWDIGPSGNVSVATIFNSDGSIGGPTSWMYSLDSQGVLTEPAVSSTHGYMTYGKDVTVVTTDFGSGSSINVMMQ